MRTFKQITWLAAYGVLILAAGLAPETVLQLVIAGGLVVFTWELGEDRYERVEEHSTPAEQ